MTRPRLPRPGGPPQSYEERATKRRAFTVWVAPDVGDGIDRLAAAWGATFRGVVERAVREAVEREDRKR